MNGVIYAATVLIWGSTWLAIAFQLGDVPVVTSIMYRFAIASLLLLGCLLITRRLQRLSTKQHLSCLALGLCLFSCNFMFFYNAAQFIPSGLISIVFSLATVMNMANGWLLYRNRPAARLMLGAATGIIGIALLFWPDLQDGARVSETGKGLILAVLGTYCFSLGNMLSARQQSQGLCVFSVNGYAMGYGALFMLGWGIISGASLAMSLQPSYLSSLVYLAVIGSVLGFSCYLLLVGRIGPQKAAYATVMFPLIALGLSTLFEGYLWTTQGFVGVAVVLMGNLLVFGNPLRLAKAKRLIKA